MSGKRVSTKERVMNAAEELVADHGFSNTSIEQICKAACISRPGFFYHFPSKDSLATQLIHRSFEYDQVLCGEIIYQASTTSVNKVDQVLVLFDLIAEYLGSKEVGRRRWLMINLLYEKKQLSDETKARMADNLLMWRSQVEHCLSLAVQEKRTQSSIDVAILSNMLMAILEGSFMKSRILDTGENLEGSLKGYRSYISQIFECA